MPPIDPGNVIQDGAPETLHAQPAPAITPTFALPPAARESLPAQRSAYSCKSPNSASKMLPDAEVKVTPGGSVSVTAPVWL